MKRPLASALFLLTLGAYALNPGWKQIDVNGDGKPEHVAVTNLADIALSEDGKVVGWYTKPFKGREIKDYARANNLVPPGLPLPGLSDLELEPRGFTDEGGLLVATFGGGDVTLRWLIDPNRYTARLVVESGAGATLVWSGIDRANNPQLLFLAEGAQTPSDTGEGRVRYLAMKTKPRSGFSFVLIPETPTEASLTRQGGGALARIHLPPGKSEVRVYGGQNELVRYHVEGLLELPGLFEPNVWGQLSLGLLALMEYFYGLVHNWGLSILMLTLVVRLLLWPLMHQQFKAMAEMQRLKPYVDEINKKYKDDPEKKNQELMKLYAEHKVNPAAGCLPMFIQLPILFILWRVIANYEFGEGFLWIPDLALPDPTYLLPLLYIVVMIAQTLLMSQGNKDALRQSIFMNLLFVYLVLQFPAGVTLYWVFSTLIGLVQQWLINRQLKTKAAG